MQDKRYWIFYGTLSFVLLVSFVELLSLLVFSLSPSLSVLYMSPFVPLFDISTSSLVLSLLYISCFLLVLFRMVDKDEQSVWLLLFYLVSSASLVFGVINIPFSLHYVFTFVFMLIFFESFYEYINLIDLSEIEFKFDVSSIKRKYVCILLIFLLILSVQSVYASSEKDGSVTVEVEGDWSYTNMSVEPDSVVVGETVNISIDVTNELGEQNSTEITFAVGENEVDTITVTVDANETETVYTMYETVESGIHTAYVYDSDDNEVGSAEFEVNEEDSGGSSSNENTDSGIDLFTAFLVNFVIPLIVVMYLLILILDMIGGMLDDMEM